ncbi:unnamed protein product [Peniophora sp. CBMAI 1063]|nr:unnamed protein product [Peniophora sp. CBMAI 1063]
MDSRELRNVLCEEPEPQLLAATYAVHKPEGIVPLLDAELHRSASRIHRLKECQNWLASPIYRLPEEILQKIFFIYARDNDELFNLRWTRLLRVSRRWRDILTHFPELWSFIELSGARRQDSQMDTATFQQRCLLQRSHAGLHALTVRIETEFSGRGSQISEEELNYLASWDDPRSLLSLSVKCSSTIALNVAHKLASHPQLVLNELKLDHLPEIGPTVPAMEAELRSLMDVILRENYTPRLQHLSLRVVGFEWARIRGLRTLHIECCHSLDDRDFFRGIIAALSRCPLLEHLHLHFAWYLGEGPTAHEVASLPNMRYLHMNGHDAICDGLLRSLRDLPSAAKLLIMAPDEFRGVDSHAFSIAEYIGAHASQANAPVIRTIVLGFGPMVLEDIATPRWRLCVIGRECPEAFVEEWSRSRSYLQSYTKEQKPLRETIPSPYIALETTVSRPEVDGAVNGRFMDIVASWPLSQVAVLDLRAANLRYAHCEALLNMFHTTTTVILRPESGTAFDFIDALRTHLKKHRSRALAHIVFDAGTIRRQKRSRFLEPTYEALARRTAILALQYSSEARAIGDPLDTVEVINEGVSSKYEPLFSPSPDINWGELCGDLRLGFVHKGVLHSLEESLDGKGMEFPRSSMY